MTRDTPVPVTQEIPGVLGALCQELRKKAKYLITISHPQSSYCPSFCHHSIVFPVFGATELELFQRHSCLLAEVPSDKAPICRWKFVHARAEAFRG